MAKRFGATIQPCQRQPVAWYSPSVLLQAAQELLSSSDFQRNLDRRESFTGAVDVIDLSAAPNPVWIDFISDSGDSGNATYAVARAALEPVLEVAAGTSSTQLPTGQVLILGGDLAYPGASPEEYQYRFLEPYEMARHEAGADTRNKIVAAIPQNHDWFDSLSTFCRYFVNRDKGDFIGARTPQKRTYFAVKLPHNWWILGFDFALGGDIDRNQFEAFRALLGMEPGTEDKDRPPPPPQITGDAQLVLVYPEPYWTRELGDGAPPGYPKRYQRLEHLFENTGARIALRLAGDLHHYARDTLACDPRSGRSSHLITCGTGGAFLHPTHCRDSLGKKVMDRCCDTHAIGETNEHGEIELQNRIRVGRSTNSETDKLSTYTQEVRYPPIDASRKLARSDVLSLFRCNFSRPRPRCSSLEFWCQLRDSNFAFAVFLGVLYGFNAYVNSLVFSLSFIPDGFGPMRGFDFGEGFGKWLHAMVYSPTALIINLIMLAGCMRIAWEGPVTWKEKLASGLLHGLAHAFCVFALYWLGHGAAAWLGQACPVLDNAFAASVCVWLFVSVGGFGIGGLLFGTYFAIANACFGQMPNNAFGALAIQSYKGFLRFKLSGGKLYAYFVGLDCVDRDTTWKTPPQGWAIKDEFEV